MYSGRIGEPTTDDEAYGYWLFVLGILLGIAGLLLFYFSPDNSLPRQLGYIAGAIGLVSLIVGPTLRLPLSRRALTLSYVGAVVCLAGIVWFTMVYPANWTGPTGHVGVISVYLLGLFLTAVGAIVAPLLTGRQEEYERMRETAETATQTAKASSAAASEATRAAEQATEERDSLAEQLATSDAAREEMATVLDATEAELTAAHETIAAAMESKATFEVYADRAGKYRWRLRHRNSNVIADSAQGYASRQKAMQGLRSVQANAAGGGVVLLPDATEDDTAEDVPEIPAEESQATYEVYEDKGGEFRWRLRHDNGNIIADGSEGYASKSNARRGLAGVKAYVAGAPYLTLDPVGFEVYPDAAGEFRWRLLHRNGNVLADSGEGYTTRASARRAAERVQKRAPAAAVDDGFEVYEDTAGKWRWRLRAENGEIVADSGQGYSNRSKAMDGLERVQNYAADAGLLPVGSTVFELFADKADEWRWRLRHRNGNVLADSGEGYTERNKAIDAIEGVKRHAPGAETAE
ncbi:YegP family protein [Haloarcula pelagica]|uniref:YegP family protein n=1 Tax=Haloarcula pelagica TaxID=3033389 RepID=UPI0024C33DA3|nr:DUF1508 domain-containing protein [Halomicroarcula sp. YJ-61-S]